MNKLPKKLREDTERELARIFKSAGIDPAPTIGDLEGQVIDRATGVMLVMEQSKSGRRRLRWQVGGIMELPE